MTTSQNQEAAPQLPADFEAPETVDLNVNGACNLDCSWCWGPVHDRSIETTTTEEWGVLIRNLGDVGTQGVVFTGGETLMKPTLPQIAQIAKETGMRTTLSTNGILLPKRHTEILPFIDDLGLPLDGATQATSERMRKPLGRTSLHFGRVLESLKLAQIEYPSIELTVRTVVGKPNVDTVHQIGGLLLSNGIDPEKLRWKLYQCNPTGPRREDIIEGDWLIGDQEFDDALERTVDANPSFTHITGQKIKDSVGRYFFVYPDGETSVNIASNALTPEGLPLNTEVPTGNIVKDFTSTMHNLWTNGFRTTRISK